MPDLPLTPRRPWKDRHVVLGVTGGIAAYKSIQVARDLTRLGAKVDSVLTRSAQNFVTPLSFEGVTGRPALTDLFSADGAALHIRLGHDADVICVAPATADLLARAAHGRSDDLICTTLLATRAPVILCPAMNDKMFSHAQVQANLAHLRDNLGYTVAGPAEGALAVGEADGPGRMIEPWQIEEHVGRALSGDGLLTGRHMLVTAGPTREALDPVRYLGNRSSGRMGFAIAQAAWRHGAAVTLVSGPTGLERPVGVDLIPVESALEMHDVVRDVVSMADVCVFAAAVSDFRPVEAKHRKVKRADAGGEMVVRLVANPDVAADTAGSRKPGSVAVGFALETNDLIENARKKLEPKRLDLIVANDATEAGSGFEVSTNRVTLLSSDGSSEELPLMSKEAVAEELIERVLRLLGAA